MWLRPRSALLGFPGYRLDPVSAGALRIRFVARYARRMVGPEKRAFVPLGGSGTSPS
jgi:hypothetical protein